MGRNRGFDPRRYARSQDVRLVAGFFAIAYLVGGAVVGWFYGWRGALAAVFCLTAGLLFFLMIYGLVALVGWWANRDDRR